MTRYYTEAIAIFAYMLDYIPSYSTGICENLTCGYGMLDRNGYWQFPLYPDVTPEAFDIIKD